MKRLFFALWPTAAVRKQIDALNQQIALTGVRKLKPQNLHLTLLYLGNIDAATQQSITEQVDQCLAKRFNFELDGLEHWQTPKILCLTVRQQPTEMLELVAQLKHIAQAFPIFLHDRPYRAHVTLMRKAKTEYTMAFAPIQWAADAFCLVESRSTPTGIEYSVLQSWPLP